MKKLLLALALVLAPSLAWAQCAGVFPANTVCGNTSASPNVPSAVPFGGTIVGPGTTVVGDFATWGNTFGTQLTDTATAGLAHGGLGGDQSAATAGQVPVFPGSGGAAVPGLPTIPLGTNVSGNLATSHLNSGTGATSSTFWRGDGTWVNPATSILGANNTWTGTNIWTGNAFFGSGSPWIDVKSGANSCAAAVGNNTADDTAAIQCQVTFINGLFGGGKVFLPCATYKVTSTITVPGGVTLAGAGRNCTILNGGNNDIEILNFTGGSNTFGGLRDLTVFGDQAGGSLTKNLIVVNAGTPVRFQDCTLWGGNFALQEDGTDGSISDCFIMGTGTNGGGITSSGANWYRRVKLDTIGVAVNTAYQQNTSSSIQENHFDMSDFSGDFTDSVIIADTDNNAITAFTNSVFSSAISITGAKATMFGAGVEFGVAVASSAPVNIVGAIGLGSITMTGAGARSCAGNFQITC